MDNPVAQIAALQKMRTDSKALVDLALPDMNFSRKRAAARLNQKILDLLNEETENDVVLAASFMAIETIAGSWEKGLIKSQLQRKG